MTNIRDARFPLSRRSFLGSIGVAGAALAAPVHGDGVQDPPPAVPRPSGVPEALARDESHWKRVAANYRVTDRVTNLEGGFFGLMATPVMAEFVRHVGRVNTENSVYVRGAYRADIEAVRARVAAALGVEVGEIAFTRGATEALQSLIGGYNRLKAGDAVMYADLDYPGMQYAMNWLAERRGVRVKRITIPEPATRANVLETYDKALAENPDVRLLLATHVNNKTGLVTPIAEVAAMARTRGVDLVVDAAHSWGQIDLKARDLGADFIGFNLHKWIGAPVGCGVLYIKNGRLGDIDRMMSDEDSAADSILSRVHSGTANFATFLTIPAALDFHDAVGPSFKAARVHYLRNRWVSAARSFAGIEILTPDEPRMAAAITSFRVRGRAADSQRLVNELRDRHQIFTVRRNGVERGDCIRVTPALYNSAADVDRLIAALKQWA